MAFTTWANLYQKMLDDLESGNWRIKSYTIGSRETTYHTFQEFQKGLEYVKAQAAAETGAIVGRTFAKQGGRG